MEKCCYCKAEIVTKLKYCIPEGFPLNPVHDGRALCDTCGDDDSLSLDKICERLDQEYERKCKRQRTAVFLSALALTAFAVGLFGSKGLIAGPLLGFGAALVLRKWQTVVRL